MQREGHQAQRYPFLATAEVFDSSGVRPALVLDLSLTGAYLSMPNPFSKGALVLIKIRTRTEFFESHAFVAHSTDGLGMGVMFDAVSPPFLIVLQRWLLDAEQEAVHRTL
jgi:PilZ domain